MRKFVSCRIATRFQRSLVSPHEHHREPKVTALPVVIGKAAELTLRFGIPGSAIVVTHDEERTTAADLEAVNFPEEIASCGMLW